MIGSFNFTKAAEEHNAENLLVARDKKLASAYTKNWYEHDGHSEVYEGEEGRKLTGRQEKTRGSYVGNSRDFSEVLF